MAAMGAKRTGALVLSHENPKHSLDALRQIGESKENLPVLRKIIKETKDSEVRAQAVKMAMKISPSKSLVNLAIRGFQKRMNIVDARSLETAAGAGISVDKIIPVAERGLYGPDTPGLYSIPDNQIASTCADILRNSALHEPHTKDVLKIVRIGLFKQRNPSPKLTKLGYILQALANRNDRNLPQVVDIASTGLSSSNDEIATHSAETFLNASKHDVSPHLNEKIVNGLITLAKREGSVSGDKLDWAKIRGIEGLVSLHERGRLSNVVPINQRKIVADLLNKYRRNARGYTPKGTPIGSRRRWFSWTG